MNQVTEILEAIQSGDPNASDQLLPVVYNELRKLAQAKLTQERAGHSLQATGLVHEAYLRLVHSSGPDTWNSKGHFFGAAAKAMRRILVEHARRKNSLKRGGDHIRITLENLDLNDPSNPHFITALDEALKAFADLNEQATQVVNLRFFAGLTIEEVAEAMEISVRTVNRHWSFAKAWLYKRLSDDTRAEE